MYDTEFFKHTYHIVQVNPLPPLIVVVVWYLDILEILIYFRIPV
ncbi:protein of unknown function [Candidatus Nitrosocosmicus franklandus]|uniref:Uncharacterized protein n=1 Tax=Candidatus Nitrosocosmicus franklandianus TaxID=1798806 RepID=A0A484I9G9_9ARCH|nr:protein of unknown function [Candidatus Nitrosocosmicus franklandus]